jgi:RimJ/RimL family protein N-acetyltransferase
MVPPPSSRLFLRRLAPTDRDPSAPTDRDPSASTDRDPSASVGRDMSAPTDCDLLVELDSDPEVMRYLSRVVPTPVSEIAAQISADVASYAVHPRWGRWLAFDRESGGFAGWFALTYGPAFELDLGYRLRRSFWGKGLATEMSRELIDYAFADASIRRVYAQTMAVNLRSRRVLEKAGLTHCRTFHPPFDDPLPGTELGEVEYEIRPRPSESAA